MANNPQFTGGYRSEVSGVDNADGTTAIKVFEAGATGSRIHAIVLGSTDTVSREVTLFLAESGITSEADMGILGTSTVTGGSGGTTATAIVSWMDKTQHPWLDDSPGRFITLGPTQALFAKVNGAITAAKLLTVSIFAGDY